MNYTLTQHYVNTIIMSIKKCLFSLLVVFLVFPAAGQERILSYDTRITVEKSGDLQVTEVITVVAEGNAIKRGIYRTFPTRYSNPMGTRFKVDFQVSEVLRDGVPEPWFTENKDNGVVVYIGDRDREITPGTHTYTLTYRTSRQVGFFKEYDELYFNAIGGDWVFPIETARVVLHLPEGASVVQKAAYSGRTGATGCQCSQMEEYNGVTTIMNSPLLPGEQLTIAVAWPKGFVHEPTTTERSGRFLKDNLHVLAALLTLALALLLYLRKWKAVGKDPRKGTIIPLFDPPQGFSAATTGFLHKMGMNEKIITALLVDMAIKGYLKIDKSGKKYRLDRLPEADPDLTPEENALGEALFSGRSQILLDQKNHAAFQKAHSAVEKSIKEQMIPTYFKVNGKHLLPGVLGSATGVAVTFVLAPTPEIPMFLLFLTIVLLALFAWLMKAPTPRGREVMDEAEGFKMYLSVAEKEQLDKAHEPDLTIERFEQLLPYAIALGVENQWGKRFENALARSLTETRSYNPAWYAGTWSTAAFSPSRFTSDLGKSFSSAISSASTPPGSASGSGGGGSAGGGGGGGGGGGW